MTFNSFPIPTKTLEQLRAEGELVTSLSQLSDIQFSGLTNDDILQRKAGKIVNRSMSQLKVDLNYTKTDLGLGNVDNTSDADKFAAIATLINKTINGNDNTFSNIPQSAVTDLENNLLAKADDDAVVKLTGNQTIAGVKTFSSAPVVPDEAYGTSYTGKYEPVTKHTFREQLLLLAAGTAPTDLDTLSDVTLTSLANDDILQRKGGVFVNRTPAQVKTDLDLTGTNSGDETTATIKTKLGITTLSGSNTGDETASTIKTKLGITTLSGANTGDETFATLKSKIGFTQRRLSEFSGSLSTAAATIGTSVLTELIIDAPTTLTASLNLTTYKNLLLTFAGTGFVNVNSGQTFTVSLMTNPGNRQVFGGAGTVLFSKGAVEYINICWYVGYASPTITTALTHALNSLSESYGQGGKIFIPSGLWYLSGTYTVPMGVEICGVGTNEFGNRGTELYYTGSGSVLFTIGLNSRKVTFRDLSINFFGYQNQVTAVQITGLTGYSTYSNHFENVGIFYAKIAIDVYSSSGYFECIQNTVERCAFIGNRTAFRNNTNNFGWKFDSCYFSMPTLATGYVTGGTAFDSYVTGNLTVNHCLFVGKQVNAAHVPATDGSTILLQHGAYNTIKFYDCQDENVHFLYRNTFPYDYVPIVFDSCLLQSHFQCTANASVVINNCRGNVTNGVFSIKDFATTSLLTLATASIGDTQIQVADLVKPLPMGATLTFTGGKTAKLAKAALVNDGYIYVEPLAQQINAASTATFTGTYARVYLQGLNDWFINVGTNYGIDSFFLNDYTRVIYPDGRVGRVTHQTAGNTTAPTMHVSQGSINFGAADTTKSVTNNLVYNNSAVISMINAMIIGGGGTSAVRAVIPGANFFTIYLTAAPGIETRVAFHLLNPTL